MNILSVENDLWHIDPTGLLDFVMPPEAEDGMDMFVAAEITRFYGIFDQEYFFDQ